LSGVLQLSHARHGHQNPPIDVLLVEDDDQIADTIRAGLELEGFTVQRTRMAEEGLGLLRGSPIDVLLLDVMLPGKSGLHLLLEMRAAGVETPVLILTARDTVGDRVLGLELGADDYLVKPFAFGELIARIRALVRRNRPSQAETLRCADLEIHIDARKVTHAGVSLALTPLEFDILKYLCARQGQIVTREMLASDVWQDRTYNALDNVIDVHMVRLRRKVDDVFTSKLLHTVRGMGFILKE
jgi:DNA-binding response OmpR family regulator